MRKGVGELIAGLIVIALGIYMYTKAEHPEETIIPVFKDAMNVRMAMQASAITIFVGIVVLFLAIRKLKK